MTRIILLVWGGFLASFKSRRQLLIENWSLRHQLQAAHFNLIRAGLSRGISPGVVAELRRDDGGGERRSACFRLFGLLGAEEPRICLVLMLVAVVLVTASAVRSFRTFAPASDTDNIWAELDSFSEPAVAEAVLRRDAETLLVNYTDSYHACLQAQDSWKRNYAAWLTATRRTDSPANTRRYETEAGKMPVFSMDGWISRFKSTLSALRERPTVESLEHTLLLIYQRDGRWSEFLDLYLDIVRKSPASLDIVSWAEPALKHASDCGRVDQVLACLQFVAQCDSHHLLANLGPILKRWSQPARISPPLALNSQVHPRLAM